MCQPCRLESIADLVGGSLQGVSEDKLVSSLNILKYAQNEELSFLSNRHYKADLSTTKALAVFMTESLFDELTPVCGVIIVKDPYLAFAQVQRYFYPQAQSHGVRHASASIDASAIIADDVDIGACSVIEAGVEVASGTSIAAGCLIGKDAHIGHDCQLHAGVKVLTGCQLHDRVILQAGAVIGSDGFGYAWNGNEHLKIPQVGRVVLHDDVEIGANTCIDRGALGDTVIQQGVKLDNLIQIGHNVEVGALTVMASQVGISGSVHVGQGCQIGGQVGTAGHLKIGDGCQLAARTGVVSDLDAGGTYGGFPAMPHRTWLKTSALVMRLPEIWKKMKNIS